VTRVVMRPPATCWKPPLSLLEAAGFEVWLVNAKDARAPAGPAQDRPAGCGVAVQAHRAAAAAAQLRAATANPPLRDPGPLPG
jgi:hypothetical protein